MPNVVQFLKYSQLEPKAVCKVIIYQSLFYKSVFMGN